MLKNLISTEEMLIPEGQRELYKEAKELSLKHDVPIQECADILRIVQICNR
jgi:hypothetical protein